MAQLKFEKAGPEVQQVDSINSFRIVGNPGGDVVLVVLSLAEAEALGSRGA
jgi:hypothetical protein